MTEEIILTDEDTLDFIVLIASPTNTLLSVATREKGTFHYGGGEAFEKLNEVLPRLYEKEQK